MFEYQHRIHPNWCFMSITFYYTFCFPIVTFPTDVLFVCDMWFYNMSCIPKYHVFIWYVFMRRLYSIVCIGFGIGGVLALRKQAFPPCNPSNFGFVWVDVCHVFTNRCIEICVPNPPIESHHPNESKVQQHAVFYKLILSLSNLKPFKPWQTVILCVERCIYLVKKIKNISEYVLSLCPKVYNLAQETMQQDRCRRQFWGTCLCE